MIELQADLKLSTEDYTFVRNHLWAHGSTMINANTLIATLENYGVSMRREDAKCRLLPSALFSYVDHLEIVEARKAAKESKKLAWIAIWISTGIGAVSMLVGGLQLYFQLYGA